MTRVVVMGVAGCGKSSLAAALATAEGLPMIEGDDFHSEANRQKLRAGTALTDSDREAWLGALAAELACRPGGAVLSCSALKYRYREGLRAAAPGLRFVFLAIGEVAAEARVRARSGGHFFNASLVPNQFAVLEPPHGEPGVLTLDALRPVSELQQAASRWLQATAG